MKRGNTRVRIVRKLPKTDPWKIFDSLPPAIRAALQEGPETADPASVLRFLRKQRRFRDDAAAIAETVREISDWHLRSIGHSSLHALADATLQTSGRTQPDTAADGAA